MRDLKNDIYNAAIDGNSGLITDALSNRPAEFSVGLNTYDIRYYAYTPLMLAIRFNQAEIVSQLLHSNKTDHIDIGLSKVGGGYFYTTEWLDDDGPLRTNHWITETHIGNIGDTVLDIAAQYANTGIFEQIINAHPWTKENFDKASDDVIKRADLGILKLFLSKHETMDLAKLKPSIDVNNAFYLYCKYGRLLGEYKNKLLTLSSETEGYQQNLNAINDAIVLFKNNKPHHEIVSVLAGSDIGSKQKDILLERLKVLHDQSGTASHQTTCFSFLANALTNLGSSIWWLSIELFFNKLISKKSDSSKVKQTSPAFFKSGPSEVNNNVEQPIHQATAFA